MAGKLIIRVLLVNDEPHIRILISECLASAGYIVQTAFDGLHYRKTAGGAPGLDYFQPQHATDVRS